MFCQWANRRFEQCVCVQEHHHHHHHHHHNHFKLNQNSIKPFSPFILILSLSTLVFPTTTTTTPHSATKPEGALACIPTLSLFPPNKLGCLSRLIAADWIRPLRRGTLRRRRRLCRRRRRRKVEHKGEEASTLVLSCLSPITPWNQEYGLCLLSIGSLGSLPAHSTQSAICKSNKLPHPSRNTSYHQLDETQMVHWVSRFPFLLVLCTVTKIGWFVVVVWCVCLVC